MPRWVVIKRAVLFMIHQKENQMNFNNFIFYMETTRDIAICLQMRTKIHPNILGSLWLVTEEGKSKESDCKMSSSVIQMRRWSSGGGGRGGRKWWYLCLAEKQRRHVQVSTEFALRVIKIAKSEGEWERRLRGRSRSTYTTDREREHR